jgi:hypothetical protein
MNLTELIEVLSARFDSDLSAPFRTAGGPDDHPVPLVLLEDWSTTDHNWQNSNFAGQVVDPEDDTEKRYFRFYYTIRIEVLVKHHDDVQAHVLLDQLRNTLFDLKRDPLSLHNDVNSVKPGGSTGINHNFVESDETELRQSFRITSFHEVKDDSYDTLEEIVNDFTVKEI